MNRNEKGGGELIGDDLNSSELDAERHLVERIRLGDAAMWQYFIDRFEGRLLAFANSRVSDREEAEDIVQDTFLGFLNSLPHFDGDRPIESYLFSIVSYKITDHFRKKSRSLPAKVQAGEQSDAPNWSYRSTQRDVSSVARSIERKHSEELAVVQAMQQQLCKWNEKRDWTKLKCLELIFVAGESNKSVSEKLHLSEQQVANYKRDFLDRTRLLISRPQGHQASPQR